MGKQYFYRSEILSEEHLLSLVKDIYNAMVAWYTNGILFIYFPNIHISQ